MPSGTDAIDVQSEVSGSWDDIAAKAERLESCSETGATAAMYGDLPRQARRSPQGVHAARRAGRGMFAVNRHLVGLDLFDSPATLSSLLGKLVESYGLDALDAKHESHQVPVADSPQTLLDEASAATVECLPAVGEGA